MKHEKANLALEQTYFAEIQMAFKTLKDVKDFERRMHVTPGRIFRYANVANTLIPTLTMTCTSADESIATIKNMIEYIKPEIDRDVCHVVVARVYNVIYSEMWSEHK